MRALRRRPLAAGATRGIPFDERTVKSNEDVEALQRLSGQASLPLLTIGTQQLKGFSDAEWSQYLDAAGYPKSVQLPARLPQAAGHAAGRGAGSARRPAAARRAHAVRGPPPPARTGPTPSNPAGIKF